MQKIVRFLPLILSICLITPLSNDIFIPSLPAISHLFHTDKTQLLLSIFMLGLAISQLIYGPFSDRFGRKPIIITGLSIFILASIMIATANNFTVLLIGRFFQAVGACCTIPSAMAILRDTYSHDELVKPVSYLMGTIVVAPIVAPLFGSYLEFYFGWRSSFIFLLFLGIFYWLVITFLFKETLENKNMDALNYKKLLYIYKRLLSHRNYVGFILALTFTYAGIFSYISVAPFLLIHNLSIPVTAFGWYFLLFAAMISIMSFTIPHIAKKVKLHYLTLLGTSLFLIGSILLLILNIIFSPSVWIIVGPMMIVGLGVGIVRPIGTASTMKLISPKIAGISSSLTNMLMFMGGVFATGLFAWIPNTALTFSICMTALGVAGLLSSFLTLKVRAPIQF
jgi:DHA1 family bicyclomycin/chloramphenicol resistance-like MFS transporter